MMWTLEPSAIFPGKLKRYGEEVLAMLNGGPQEAPQGSADVECAGTREAVG